MTPDSELLRRFADENSEAAFTELTERHLNLVYSAALRQTNGDAPLAADVTQKVFFDLASKATALARRPVLTGWLYTSTHFAAAKAVRAERRRQAREQEAHTMRELLQEPAPEPAWEDLRPVLDTAMQKLKEPEREAILLRFFENRQLAEIGSRLGVTESGARMRVDRALDKLRKLLAQRGITTTVGALSSAISLHAVQAAPAGLQATLAAASLTAAGGGTLSFLNLMTMTKIKSALVGTIVAASVATTLVIQNQSQANIHDVDSRLKQQGNEFALLQAESNRLASLASPVNRTAVNDLAELERARLVVAPLRKDSDALALLRQEEHQLQAKLEKIRQDLPNRDTNWGYTTNSLELHNRVEQSMALSIAMWDYASEHQENYPTNLEPVLKYVRPAVRNQTNFLLDRFEIVYRGKTSDIRRFAHPDRIILVREKQPLENVDGRKVMVWNALNGMGSWYTPSDGNFEPWLREHTAVNRPTSE